MSIRLETLRTKLEDYGLDALVVNQPENRRYLSGFTGSAGVLVISQQDAYLATDFRYYTQAAAEAPTFELARVGYKFTDHLTELLTKTGAKRVGFESESLTVAEFGRWQAAAPDIEWVATSRLVEDMRAVKSAEEIDRIRRAVDVGDQAFAHVVPQLRPGITEQQVAWMLQAAMHELGAEDIAFNTIVAAGPDSAKPHYHPTDKELVAGAPIVIDVGALVDGYRSDMTRTVVIGEPDAKFQEIYNLVLEAEEKAVAAIRAGMNGVEADATARGVIEEAGHADDFGHGLGHGVGLAIHEAPKLSYSASEEDLLASNMVVTIEPGVYLSDWGGVRIEDLVVVREDGLEILTQTPKALEAQVISAS